MSQDCEVTQRQENISVPIVLKIANLPFATIRFYAFLAAIVIYSFFSSPTPDQFGGAESVIALLLLFSVGAHGAYTAIVKTDMPHCSWENIARVLLIGGLIIPTGLAVLLGNDERLLMRDLIPFLFLMLPLFMKDLLWNHFDRLRALILVSAFSGLMFAFRSLPFFDDGSVFDFLKGHHLYYLANAPTVLFCAIFLTGLGFRSFFDNRTFLFWSQGVLMMAVSIIPLTAMALTLQRASLGAWSASVLVIIVLSLRYNLPRWLVFVSGVFVLGIFMEEYVWSILLDLILKTQNVGSNMRLMELSAVWNSISQNLWSTIFGLGWGATYQSPAVGNLTVNFTHSLLTSMLLKTGLVGLFLIVLYVIELTKNALNMLKYAPVIGLALLCPFLIDVLFYAAYKSFDFGLILILMAYAPIYSLGMQGRIEKKTSVLY